MALGIEGKTDGMTGKDVDLTRLPVVHHNSGDGGPYITAGVTTLLVLRFDFLAGNDLTRGKRRTRRRNDILGTKAIDVCVYDGFLKFMKIPWEPPEYKPERKAIFFPNEEEIDQLIAGAGKKLAVFLQLLKETGMRSGEAARLKWINIDFQKRLIGIDTEKGSNPRMIASVFFIR
jgi:integrase